MLAAAGLVDSGSVQYPKDGLMIAKDQGVPEAAHPLLLGERIDIAFSETLTTACQGHGLHRFNVAAHACCNSIGDAKRPG